VGFIRKTGGSEKRMSPLLGFTKLFDELVSEKKLQTIRLPRKYPIQEGDVLFVYWKLRTKECRKLGIAYAYSVVRKRFCELTELDASRDGFSNLLEFKKAFCDMHPQITESSEVDVIRFVWGKKEVGK
jgi:hypothetical protein